MKKNLPTDARLSDAFDAFLRALSRRSAPTGVRMADVVAMLKSRKAEILASLDDDIDPAHKKWSGILQKIIAEIEAGNTVLLDSNGYVRYFDSRMIPELFASNRGLSFNLWWDASGKRHIGGGRWTTSPFLYHGSTHNFYTLRPDNLYYHIDDGSVAIDARYGSDGNVTWKKARFVPTVNGFAVEEINHE